MANTYLQRSTTTRTNDRKFTYSCWFKRSKIGTGQYFVINLESGNDRGYISFDTADKIFIYDKAGGTERFVATSNFVLRDTSAWYHLVYSVDSTASSNRTKIYINGVDRYSDFTVTTAMSQNVEVGFQKGVVSNGFKIGSQEAGSTTFSGLMSHINFVDGLQLDASTFGSTDANGVWTIKTSPTVSEYGNNGFFILKDGNSVTDQSGKGNNFTVGGGTLTKTEDCPSNVFCVLNRLNSDQPTGSVNISNGNLTFADGENGSNYSYASGTLGANSGKFYWETKVTDLAEIDQVGVVLASSNFMGAANSTGLQGTAYGGKGCQFSNGYKVGDGSGGAYMGGFSVNDIMMIALDLDNNKITFGRNGQWADGSGNANQTYANSTPAYTNLTAGEFYFPAQAKRAYGANYGTNHYNFGNGYFQTTAVSSAGTNASGIGIFEYDVPTGYTALSTKGLNL